MADIAEARQVRRELPLVDSAQPETYVDNFAGISLSQANLHLTFATSRADHTKQPPASQRVVSSRLVMPIAVAREVHQILGEVLRDVESKVRT